MKRKATLWLIPLALAALIGLSAGQASAILYTFDSNPPPDWGNEIGNWIAANGVYRPNTPPIDWQGYGGAASLLPFNLTNPVFEVDSTDWHEAGVWLRFSYNEGKANGVLWVEDRYGQSYFHVARDGVWTQPINQIRPNLYQAHIKIIVSGDNYNVYANGNLINSLVNSDFASGQVGLFGNHLTAGAFDNVNVVPIPGTMLLLGSGLLGLAGLRLRFRKG